MNQWNQSDENYEIRIIELSKDLEQHLSQVEEITRKKLYLQVLEEIEMEKCIKLSDRLHDFLMDTVMTYLEYQRQYAEQFKSRGMINENIEHVFQAIEKYLSYYPDLKAEADESRAYRMIRDEIKKLYHFKLNKSTYEIIVTYCNEIKSKSIHESIQNSTVQNYQSLLEEIKQCYNGLNRKLAHEIKLIKQSQHYKLLQLQIRYLERALKILANQGIQELGIFELFYKEMEQQLKELFDFSVEYEDTIESAAIQEMKHDEWHEKKYLSIIIRELNRIDFSLYEQIGILIAKEKDNMINSTNKNAKKSLSNYNREMDKWIKLLMELRNLIRRLKGEELLSQFDLDSDQMKIAGGVYQAIQFKIKSLDENLQTLTDEKKLGQKKLEKLIIEHKKIIYPLCDQMAIHLIEGNSQEKDKIFKRIEKMSFEVEDKANQMMRELIKENILNEIVTFDELMGLSLPKIIQITDAGMEEWLKTCVNVYNEVQELLPKYKIMRIQPKPKSQFDSKMHHIISGEEKKGFKKGEIIETYQVGYSYNEVPIIRAQIICAK